MMGGEGGGCFSSTERTEKGLGVGARPGEGGSSPGRAMGGPRRRGGRGETRGRRERENDNGGLGYFENNKLINGVCTITFAERDA